MAKNGNVNKKKPETKRAEPEARRPAPLPATRPRNTGVTASKEAPTGALATRMAKESQRRGMSSDQKDNLVPMVYILQSNSPQAIKRNPAYIEGAEGGMIWLRNSAQPLVSGDEGILFQPCVFRKDVVEWIDRDDGGGFVTRHEFKPEDEGEIENVAKRLKAKRVEDDKNPNRVRYIMANNHELIETRYHIGYVYGQGAPQPFVIPLKSTGHTFSRAWMVTMNTRALPTGEVPDSWASMYRLITKFKTNASGDWFAWELKEALWVQNDEDYERGEALFEAFDTGQKDIEAPEDLEVVGGERSGGRSRAGGAEDEM